MSFKEVQSLDCDFTTALGGRNKTTGKVNPTEIEGYYLGYKEVANKKARSGIAKLYVLQTSEGNVGVWGKTDLDRKMPAVTKGCMIRISQNGTVPTPNGDMYRFKVEIDETNTIDITEPVDTKMTTTAPDVADADEDLSAEDDDPEVTTFSKRPTPPTKPASVPDAERQAKVKALLQGVRK